MGLRVNTGSHKGSLLENLCGLPNTMAFRGSSDASAFRKTIGLASPLPKETRWRTMVRRLFPTGDSLFASNVACLFPFVFVPPQCPFPLHISKRVDSPFFPTIALFKNRPFLWVSGGFLERMGKVALENCFVSLFPSRFPLPFVGWKSFKRKVMSGGSRHGLGIRYSP